MGKCLVTRLQEVVNNSDLKLLGEIRLVAKGVSVGNEGVVRVSGCNGGKVIIEGGTAYAEEGRTTALGSKFDITSDNFFFVVSDGDCVIKITSVYSMTRIATGVKVIISLPDLGYAPTGVILAGYPAKISGNIDSLGRRESASVVLQMLDANNTVSFENCSGNIANIDKFAIDYNGQGSEFGVDFKGSNIAGDASAFATFNSNLKEKLTYISTNTTNVGKLSGNVEAFKDYTNMVHFDLNYIPLTGNLATALGHMTKATLFAVGGHAVAEDLKNLFDALRANGKTSGSIVCWMGSNKTLNGGTWTDGSTVTFTASGWSVA